MSEPLRGRGRKRPRSNGEARSQLKTFQETSPFAQVVLRLCCSLLPASLADVAGGVRRQLFRMLMRHNSEVDGIIVGFCDITFAKGQEHGRILDEEPLVHFNIIARALVFAPRVGTKLMGEVREVTQTHVAVLVDGIFNASLHADELAKVYIYREAHDAEDDEEGDSFNASGTWQHRYNEDEKLRKGDKVRFLVKKVQHGNRIMSIQGGLEDFAGDEASPRGRSASFSLRAGAGEADLPGPSETSAVAQKAATSSNGIDATEAPATAKAQARKERDGLELPAKKKKKSKKARLHEKKMGLKAA